jgi:lipoprotein signal peptidase
LIATESKRLQRLKFRHSPQIKASLHLRLARNYKFLGGGMKIKIKLLFLFIVLIFIDQASKHFSSDSICNQNIAWSVPIAPAIFYFVWLVIVSVLIYIFFKTKKYNQKIFLTIVFSGAISNMIDRIRLGCVVDYIDLKFWPVFNLADIYITIGVIMLLINLTKTKSRKASH